MGNTILIAEDDKLVLKLLKNYFSLSGFTVYTAETCKDVIRLAGQHLPDCFLFDYHLGEEDITPACLFIRSHGRLKNTPMVILSGDSSQSTYTYNTCQADVFLEKGGGYPVILAAVKRQLRRPAPADGIVRRSDLALDTKSLSVLREGKSVIPLSPEQFIFFSMLFERSPQFVCEEELCRQVFKADFLPSMRKALNMLAYRLRIKLGPQLARRVKNSRPSGWVYMQPRDRQKTEPLAENTAIPN